MSIHKATPAPLVQALRAAGHRITSQRIVVFEALGRSRDHPSAEALYRRVRRRHPTISRASVYKALNLFASLGLLAELKGADGLAHFDGEVSPHANMVCVRCGAIEDLRDIDVEALLQRVARLSGFAAEPHLNVRGICPACTETQDHRKAGRRKANRQA